MTVLVDDQLLGRLLRGERSAELPATVEVYTTVYWYVRLCQSVLAHTEITGWRSAPFLNLSDSLRRRTLAAALDLPDRVGLVSNTLSIEALAAALYLGDDVLLSAQSPMLADALGQEGRCCTVMGASG